MNKKIWIAVILIVAIAGIGIIIKTNSLKNTRLIEVVGTNFSFSPSEIKVKKGERIEIVFINNGSYPHNWVVDEFNAQTLPINPGHNSNAIFTPDKTGKFTYYCSVNSHREKGMIGSLIVE